MKSKLINLVEEFEKENREIEALLHKANNPAGTHLQDYNSEYITRLKDDLLAKKKRLRLEFGVAVGDIRMKRKALYEEKHKEKLVEDMTDRELEETKVKALLLNEELSMINEDNVTDLTKKLMSKYEGDKKALTLLKNKVNEIDPDKAMFISVPDEDIDRVDLALQNYLLKLDQHLDLALKGLHLPLLGLEGLLNKVDDNLLSVD